MLLYEYVPESKLNQGSNQPIKIPLARLSNLYPFCIQNVHSDGDNPGAHILNLLMCPQRTLANVTQLVSLNRVPN